MIELLRGKLGQFNSSRFKKAIIGPVLYIFQLGTKIQGWEKVNAEVSENFLISLKTKGLNILDCLA